jgi:hypothetical protein
MKTAVVNLPLHDGKCPSWLFARMRKLGSVVSEIIINEFGQESYLKRLADPYFFQAFGCLMGMDWHSSGTTSTVCGALKSLNKSNLGIKVAGGKGKLSRKTPQQIEIFGKEFNLSTNKINKLIYSSKISAKVDSILIQDNYQLYHHCFILDEKGNWVIIQQGMNESVRYARRYQWLSDNLNDFINEPHNAICCNKKENNVLDMTSNKSKEARDVSLDIINDNPSHLKKYFFIKRINKGQRTLDEFNDNTINNFTMPPNHKIIDMDKRNLESLKKAYEIQPKTYEELIALKGIGAKTIRSLALISELIYGARASWKDPTNFAFALGGKDKIPFEIDRKHYDETTNILKLAIDNAKIGDKDKLYAIKRLNQFYN